ncbi:MAG: M36 family metallopeptidase, partial [Saprospiraceae bacterium]
MNIIKKSIFLSLISVFTIYDGHAQESIVKIKELITQKWALAHFPLNDISNFQITDQYTDENTGITYVYAQEYAGNIPIENAIANFAFKNNKAVVANLSPWVNNISEKLISASQVISASDAAITAIIPSTGKSFLRSKPQIKIKISENHVLFEKPEQLLDDVPAELVYKIDEHQKLILYWKVGVHDSSGKYWENFVNASSGNIDVRKNQTLACVSGHIHASKNYQPSLPFTQLVPQFRVWPIPLSAPNDGNPQLVSDPADKTASASGWNNDGTTPFKITKGNNVHAFSDPDSNYVSANDEPIGGDNLVFDYSYDPSGTIDKNKNAAIVNLFYMNNIMHDFSYYYGFDEKAGNFQKKNFTSSGKGNDWVIALGQYGYNNSRIRNNADFLPLPDGSNGRMRMFIWNVTGEKLLKIIDPVSIATDLETGSADFAPTIGTIPTKGKVAIVSDGSNTPTLGCKTLTNAAEVSGKIAVIDRGDCFFHQKACFAQAAGAIAVIIINFENAPNNMSGLSPAPCSVTIPVISVSSADGDIIRKNASTITLSIQKPLTNSNLERDGSFDNGVIAHEYGHGISTRLTGGPSNSGCLGNDEQMGEGWSDFMTLVTTAKPGATGNGLQGIGTYPIQQTTTDRGIRKYPYTTNFAVNGQTYESIFTTDTPHALGEIWTLMLWDLYWKMVAK